jgi:hypothetical protein
VRLVQAIVAEARVLWRQSGKFPLDSSDPNALGQVLHAAGALPSNAWDAASGTIRSPWGGKDINQQQGSLWQSAGHADRGRI